MQERVLRNGVTTGTCAAAAAKAAAVQLLLEQQLSYIELQLPNGEQKEMKVSPVEYEKGGYSCFRVQKDAGDDPDVTHGTWILVTVSYHSPDHCPPTAFEGDSLYHRSWYQSEHPPFLFLAGGTGVGVVTKPGLLCPVGMHAINPVPRKMIFDAVKVVMDEAEYQGPIYIWVDIPEGEVLAKKTFNPRLGIEGGISILGTSGIVVPMSEQALIATIDLEIHMKVLAGQQKLMIVPGNYGEQFLNKYLPESMDQAVKCSNFIYDTIQILVRENVKQILFAGHIGKLIKIAGGVKNTHSKYGDRRMEILVSCLEQSIEMEITRKKRICEQVLGANTTEEALAILFKAGVLSEVTDYIIQEITAVMEEWSGGMIAVEVVMFSNVYGILGRQNLLPDGEESPPQKQAADGGLESPPQKRAADGEERN